MVLAKQTDNYHHCVLVDSWVVYHSLIEVSLNCTYEREHFISTHIQVFETCMCDWPNCDVTNSLMTINSKHYWI